MWNPSFNLEKCNFCRVPIQLCFFIKGKSTELCFAVWCAKGRNPFSWGFIESLFSQTFPGTFTFITTSPQEVGIRIITAVDEEMKTQRASGFRTNPWCRRHWGPMLGRSIGGQIHPIMSLKLEWWVVLQKSWPLMELSWKASVHLADALLLALTVSWLGRQLSCSIPFISLSTYYVHSVSMCPAHSVISINRQEHEQPWKMWMMHQRLIKDCWTRQRQHSSGGI